MQGISIVTKSATGEVHSIVVKSGDRLRAVPVAKDSDPWVRWVDDSNASFNDVKNCLDSDLQNELPQAFSTQGFCDIQDKAGFAAAYNTFILSDSDSFLRIKSQSKNMGNRFINKRVALKTDITTSFYNKPLSEFENPVDAANFKAWRFATDTKYAAFKIQLKAVRAFFDPDIGPGGGWRCPEGTLNGGQITDRFGRGCGGLTRRLGRLLGSLSLPSSPTTQRSRSVAKKPKDRQVGRSRRTVQRSGSQSVTGGEGRPARQTARIFDRQQQRNGDLVEGFRRSPEFQSRRTEAVAAEVASRRQQRGQDLQDRNIERADRRMARDSVDPSPEIQPQPDQTESTDVVPEETQPAPARRRRRVADSVPVTEETFAMASGSSKPDHFKDDKRSLDDPVKTDVIEGRSLEQIKDVMKESEKEFSFGRDPSGDFEAAEQFARAYNTIANEIRQAVRQLQAFENGEFWLPEEESMDLERFLIKAQQVFDSALPGFDFALKTDTKFTTPFGRPVNLGLAHPRFNDEDRLAFITSKADFVGAINDAAFNSDIPFEQRMLRTKELFDELLSQRKVSVSDESSRKDISEALSDAGRKTFTPGEMKAFFEEVYGIDQGVVELLVDGVENLRRAQNLRQQFDEAVQENSGTSEPEQRMELFLRLERNRHIAFDAVVNALRFNSSNPFNGPLKDDLVSVLRESGVFGAENIVNEQRLRSSRDWTLELDDLRSREGDLYFGVAESFDELKDNYFQRNDDVDSPDRHKFMVDLVEGRYEDAASAPIGRRFRKRDQEFQDAISSVLARNLERVFPKGRNNEGLIGRIDQAAAMGFIVEDFEPDSVVAQGRKALDRRRNIISKLGKKAEERLDRAVQQGRNRRRSVTGEWLAKRYGKWSAKPWKDYSDRFGGHPITPDNFEDAFDNFSTDPVARQRITDWVNSIYEIDYESPAGHRYSTTVTSVRAGGGHDGFDIEGDIDIVTASGGIQRIGTFMRSLGVDSSGFTATDTIYNNYFALSDYDYTNDAMMTPDYIDQLRLQGIDPGTLSTTRNSGFGTIFNQHAWNWLKDAGFKRVSIKAALADGPYVWARTGFRPTKVDDLKTFWDKTNQELLKYEIGSQDGSIIKTDLQAAMIRKLSDTAKSNGFNPESSPSHMHLIMALEADSDDPSARKQEVRDWIMDNDMGLNRAEFDLDAVDISPIGPDEGPAPRRNTTALASTPAAMPDALGAISTPVSDRGDIALPKEIINPSIKNIDDALGFVRSGGSLNEVPNEFWPDVLEGNSSADPNDRNALFYSPAQQQGIGGWVNVYLAKDDSGSLTGAGWAVKNTAGKMTLARPEKAWAAQALEALGLAGGDDSDMDVGDPSVGRNHSAVYDVLGFNLAATAGLAPFGAGYGGTQQRQVLDASGQQIEAYLNSTILPLHWSVLPDGVSPSDVTFPTVGNFDAAIFENAKLRGIPERASFLLHSWSLGVGDRHGNNVASFVDKDGNAYVFPFDYGLLIERDSNIEPESIEEYLNNPRVGFVDSGIFQESREFFQRASFDDRERLRQRINEVVDRMLDGYSSVVSEGFASFSSTALSGFESTFLRMMRDRPDSTVDFAEREANEKANIMERLQEVYSSLEFVVEDRDTVKSELIRLLLGNN